MLILGKSILNIIITHGLHYRKYIYYYLNLNKLKEIYRNTCIMQILLEINIYKLPLNGYYVL